MFENIVGQPATDLLRDDVMHARLPAALLFVGPPASGKLTAALELARVLSCTQGGVWQCPCAPCVQHTELLSPELLVMGIKDLILEIRASARAYMSVHTQGTRYLFVRAVRKLITRFDERLWDSDDTRFSAAVSSIAELDQELASLPAQGDRRTTPEQKERVQRICVIAERLQQESLYTQLPVQQIRNAIQWVRLTPSGRKKVLIIEHAHAMHESARTAFLKILEEPPRDTLFILTTATKYAIMPTVLSRVRSYSFRERSVELQCAVITRVFHDRPTDAKNTQGVLLHYLYQFLSFSLEEVQTSVMYFWLYVCQHARCIGRIIPDTWVSVGTQPQVSGMDLTSLDSTMHFFQAHKQQHAVSLFFSLLVMHMRTLQRTTEYSARNTECFAHIAHCIEQAHRNVQLWNLTIQGTLEHLAHTIANHL